MRRVPAICITSLIFIGGLSALISAQQRLPDMPRYDRYQNLNKWISETYKAGNVAVTWNEDGTFFTFRKDDKLYRFDVATKAVTETEKAASSGRPTGRNGRNLGQRDRGRQFAVAYSADGEWTAKYKDRNLYLANKAGIETQITTDGSVENRIKNAVASWVYGEELNVTEAMWFSPDSKKLAFYRFDESEVQDYFLAMSVTKVQNALDVEAYPKAGAPNPKAEIIMYDLATKKFTKIDKDFDSGAGPDLGHYVYAVRWSPDGKELLFNRTNRKQNTMEFCAANPDTGKCRVIVRETQPQSWTDNSPSITWLDPQPGKPQRFIWVSERNGFDNYYMGDMSGAPLKPITQHKFEVGGIVRVDEKGGVLFYNARSAPNPYLMQLHRIGLDGKNDKRLTDPTMSHQVSLQPGGEFFVDSMQNMSSPPKTVVCDSSGKVLHVLSESDISEFAKRGFKPAQRFKFMANDGKTELYGKYWLPSDFDPKQKYPMLLTTYAGPDSGGGTERFETPPSTTEFGFVVVSIDGRGTQGRGKAFKDALYGKLGIVEIDDQASGMMAMSEQFPWADGKRVGVYGTSYGGYTTVMCLLRYPDVFHVGVASSAVTAWYNYDTIYTERYQGLPWENENKAGYEAGSAMTYTNNLKGRLLLFYGTADNNVHPSNSYQLAKELRRANKSFDMMAGPDEGHAFVGTGKMLEYFVENLIFSTPKADAKEFKAMWKAAKKK
ncbi:MAG: DPP IV N-terminal domain-containing protein [Fimbriimonadaceae bacterium]|nr:DPP IV N-terminal domain-containing protein [Fimbriimonadaceae bacterium]